MSKAMIKRCRQKYLKITINERLELLKQYYLDIFIEDPINGSELDNEILDFIEKLQTKYEPKIDLLSTTDSIIWVSEFCKKFNNPGQEVMTILFANAIETGRSLK